ncbi:response regulator transcription factor [Streptomyces sp. NPDC058735]|uniref:response regulator transcription factor n=1 Tax=unclassified Streptomyces TaxID=2593676 RepID=UPI0036A300FC
MTVRVLLADDQSFVRTGTAVILSSEDDTEVVAQADPQRLLERFVRPAVTAGPVRSSSLAKREAEVTALVSHGHTDAHVAASPHISVGTVKTPLTDRAHPAPANGAR